MIAVNVVCPHCGTPYTTPIDSVDKTSLCPAKNCYGKTSKCAKCDNKATFTQPDKETGEIIDVCDKHFIFKYMG